MDTIFVAILSLAAFGFASCHQKCSGFPLKYKGKPCASTTRYVDYHKGACGCGPDKTDKQFVWNHNGFVTAPNQLLFDSHGSTWCGRNCGRCVRLTTTGGYINGRGGPTREGQSTVFMITNVCPRVAPNLDWCAQTHNNPRNKYGYSWHFDLENGAGQINSLGWNNPEVTMEWTDCNQAHKRDDRRTPSNNDFRQCHCRKHHEIDTNETLVFD